MPRQSGLLSVGITQYPEIHSFRVFEIGGLGIITSTRPFDIDQLPITASSTRSFDILGSTVAYSTRPFDFLGALRVLSTRPFDIIELVTQPAPGTVIPGQPTVIDITLSAPAIAGDTTVQVASLGAVVVGSVVSIDGEVRTVTAIS